MVSISIVDETTTFTTLSALSVSIIAVGEGASTITLSSSFYPPPQADSPMTERKR